MSNTEYFKSCLEIARSHFLNIKKSSKLKKELRTIIKQLETAKDYEEISIDDFKSLYRQFKDLEERALV